MARVNAGNDLVAIIQENNVGRVNEATDQNSLEALARELLELLDADSNIKNLSTWFASNNPKWKLNFSAANSYTDKSGKLNEWVTTGAQVTQTIDGKEVKYNQYFDVNLVNGKIQRMFVTERIMTAGE